MDANDSDLLRARDEMLAQTAPLAGIASRNRAGLLSIATALFGFVALPVLSSAERETRRSELARKGMPDRQIQRHTRGVFGMTYGDLAQMAYLLFGYPAGGVLALCGLGRDRPSRWLAWVGLGANCAPYLIIAVAPFVWDR